MLNLYSNIFFILEILYMQQILSLPLENDSRSIYDQRQTGKYNIHISLKDVAIIEVDKNEFIDDTDSSADDYYYDDDDLTIKPISSWSISTTTRTTPIFNTSSKELMDLHLVSNKSEMEMQIYNHKKNATKIGVENPSINLNRQPSLLLSSTHSSIAIGPDTDVLQVIEPVLHNQKASQANIPQLHSAQKNRKHTDVKFSVHNSKKFEKSNQLNSTVLNIISAQTLSPTQFNICKNNGADASGNCRKKRRSTILKSLFDILKLIRLKDI